MMSKKLSFPICFQRRLSPTFSQRFKDVICPLGKEVLIISCDINILKILDGYLSFDNSVHVLIILAS